MSIGLSEPPSPGNSAVSPISEKVAALLRRMQVAMIPPPKRWTDEWAAANVILPPKSAEPGPYRPERVPYTIPIMRAFDDPRWRMVVFVMGSQMTKSTSVLNVIGKRQDDNPVPIIYFGPSRNFVETVIEPRLTDMLWGSQSLRGKTVWGKKNRKTLKMVSGAEVRLGWAGSATELAGQPAGLVFVDERDRMAADINGEGDPVELARARGETYPGFCVGVTSTPLIGNVETERNPKSGLTHWRIAEAEDLESPTWKLWQEGTRCEWAWPCPHCGVFFIPRFSGLKFDSATPATALKSAHFECVACGCFIEDYHKTAMNARGVYVAPGQSIELDGTVTGPALDGEVISFWASGLASPFVSWGARASDYIRAVRSGDQTRLQTVINTRMGELFRSGGGGEVKEWARIAALAGTYETGDVPYGVQKIALTVDVQKMGLYYVVRGWGHRWESWLLSAGYIAGETDRSEVWNDLATLIDGGVDGLPIGLTLIDSGYQPGDKWRRPSHAVYDFCRRYPGGRVRAIKGVSTASTPIKTASATINYKGKPSKRAGVMLHILDSDFHKSWVMARLDWPQGDPGGWHVPDDVTEDYCRQIVAETRIMKPSGAPVWVRHHRDNHYLDAEAMQVAAASLMQVQALRALPALSDDERPAAVFVPPKFTRGVRSRFAEA